MVRPGETVIQAAVDNVDVSRNHTVKDVAGLLNISPDYVRRLIRGGVITAVKPTGGQFRIQGSEVQRLLGGILREGAVPRPAQDNDVDPIDVPQESANRVFPPNKSSGTERDGETPPEERIGFHHLFEEGS